MKLTPAAASALLLFLASPARAGDAGDPHNIAPPEILQMDSLPNAGELFVEYCLIGHHGCISLSTSCHGQCCSQAAADDIGYGCSGDVYGTVPPGFHYSGWHCEPYGKTIGKMSLSGKAGPVPSYIKQCTNSR